MEITPILIVVLALFVITVLWYWKKGLMVTVLEAVAIIVAIVAASILAKPVSNMVNESLHIDTKISKAIINTISIDKILNLDQIPEEYKDNNLSGNDEDVKIEDVKEIKENAEKSGANIDFLKIDNEKQREIIDHLPLPTVIKNKLIESLDKGISLDLDDFAEKISLSVAKIIVNAICFVGIFIAVMIIWRIVILASDVVSKLPVIKTANSLGGLLIGIVIGVVRVWILFAIITMFASTEWGKTLIGQINSNELLNWINSNNYIVKFISNIL